MPDLVSMIEIVKEINIDKETDYNELSVIVSLMDFCLFLELYHLKHKPKQIQELSSALKKLSAKIRDKGWNFLQSDVKDTLLLLSTKLVLFGGAFSEGKNLTHFFESNFKENKD